MRRTINRGLVAAALLAASLSLISGQRFDARNTVPDTIQQCYLNTTAYFRFTRQPMHIENLIAIIRKIEQKTDEQWDIRRIARTLVHRYMFDGMLYNSDAKPEFAFNQRAEERTKSRMIKEMIPINQEESFRDDILDNDEKCALHWMLSHSINATMREEELNPGYNPGNPGNGNNPGYGNGGNNPGYGGGNPGYGGNNPGYGGNNPGYGGNPNYGGGNNPYGNNGNGNTNNNNGQNFGNSYRGKRDVTGQQSESSEEDGDGFDLDKEKGKDKVTANNTKRDSAEAIQNDFETLPEINSESTSSSSKSARQIQDTRKRTRQPIETGAIYTNWGIVSAGRLIAGIAAGLEPLQMTVSNGGTVYSPPPTAGGQNPPWSGGNGNGNGNPNWGTGSNNNNNNNNNNGNTPWKSLNGQPQYPGQNPQYPGQQPQYPGQNPPQSQPNKWGRRKRQVSNFAPIESVFAATLAGDAGQAAIMNAVSQLTNMPVPTGKFNDSICPREYILDPHPILTKEIYKPTQAWTALTEAEVRGGLDGLILGINIRRWDPSYTLRLSDILAQYYSETGISGESNFRACDRSSLLGQTVDGQKLKDQARSFAYVYNNRTDRLSDQTIAIDPNSFERIVDEAFQKMYSVASSMSNISPSCTQRPPVAGDTNDNEKYRVPKLTVYGVLDQSGTLQDIEDQKRFLGQLVYELNVSPTGSRLGVVDGNSGNMIISPNWTDVSPVLACRILGLQLIPRTQDYTRVLTNLRGEIEKVKNDEIRYNYTNSNGLVILLMVQGRRLDDNQKNEIKRLTTEINDNYGDVSVIATSNKYQESDFEGIRFVQIQNTGQNFSEAAKEFAQGLIRNTHGALRYLTCDPDRFPQDEEHLQHTTFFVSPGTIEYFKISPDYFYSARSLILRFTSDNGRVRICKSRSEWYPNSSNEGSNGVQCQATSGTYVVPGSTDADVEFRDGNLHKPCGKKGKREGCDPIYISITPIEFKGPGQVGYECSKEGCQASNQVKVTFTHWDMRCSGARAMFSSTIALLTAALAMINWLKST